MRHYLVIANQTLGGSELKRVIRDRMNRGPCHFHVVVPATRTPGLMGQIFDALAGEPDQAELTRSTTAARDRLSRELDRLRQLGAEADGAVGTDDPLTAVRDALARGDFDEVLLSTLPAGASQWVGMDLPRQVERAVDIPVTHIQGPPGEPND